MARTKTRSAVKNRWNSKAYDRLYIVVPKGRLVDIREYSKASGGTVNSVTNELWRAALGIDERVWANRSNT